MSCSDCGKLGATPTTFGDDGPEEYPSSVTNACKLCTPLGACLAFKGVAGTVPFLHGSQGCATYIRRYLISHFREPMDIAASNFAEHSAIFGGREVLHTGLANVTRQYLPELIGIATTCLSETIGENMPALLHEYRQKIAAEPGQPALVHVSTPSYRGTHADGYYAAVRALVETLAEPAAPNGRTPITIFPGFVSAADLRHFREMLAAFKVPAVVAPDYSDTMDGSSWAEYQRIPAGGTPVSDFRGMSRSVGAIECGRMLTRAGQTAATHLAKLGVPIKRLGFPIGIRETDAFCAAVTELSGKPMPAELEAARGRLIDAMVDGHKYVFNQRAVVYGEEDFVIGLTSFLCEVGIKPVLCATGGRNKHFAEALRTAVPELPENTIVRAGADFSEIETIAVETKPDVIVGHSKGYALSRRLNIPLLRCGFPIHDRLGGHRVLHVGYAGAINLYDALVNLILARKQESSSVGYSYL